MTGNPDANSGGAANPTLGSNPALIAAGVRWFGRVDTTTPDRPRFAWSGTGFVARFDGTSLSVQLSNDDAYVFKTVIDGQPQPAFAAQTGQAAYVLASNLPAGVHQLEFYRQTEAFGNSQLISLSVEGQLLDPPAPSERLIEVVGASVSAGFGNLQDDPCAFSFATESHFDTYETVAARALNAELMVLALSGRGVTRNTDGTTAGTMPLLYDRVLPDGSTPAWSFRATPQVVVINLGKNDFTVGDPGQALVQGFVDFSRTIRNRYASAFIIFTTGPNLAPNHEQQIVYVNQAIAMLDAAGDSNVALLDWDEIVSGEIGCGYHPNLAKHLEMGSQLAALIRARLGW